MSPILAACAFATFFNARGAPPPLALACAFALARAAGARRSALVAPTVRTNQNTSFRPNCSSRIGFLVELILPKLGLNSVVFGSFQIGQFGKLNASNRNCSVLLPVSLKFLIVEKSHENAPGPVTVFLPASPNVPSGSRTNASVLNQRAVVR